MTVSTTHRPQLFYTTPPAPCPYLPGRVERKVITELSGSEANALHDRLSRAGFRRSHNIAYAPVCAGCHACVPIRIPVAAFQPDRTQKRTLRQHADLRIVETAARATSEQYALFNAYQNSRHEDGDMALMSFEDYRSMIESSPVETSLIEFRTPQDRLVCVSLIDRLSDGLSAVYTFFDPAEPHKSYGSHSILWLISYTTAQNLSFLYLGYWVRDSTKMAYKARYRPSEVMMSGHWERLPEGPSGFSGHP